MRLAHLLLPRGRAASPVRPWLALGLAVALLWAQWLGAVHRVEHAAGLDRHAAVHLGVHLGTVADATAEPGHAPGLSTTAYHSCVLFDGLCLADALPGAHSPALVATVGRGRLPALAFLSRRAAAPRHYRSRAPPTA